MTLSLPLTVAMIVLYAAGVYLLLERSFTRMLFGIILVGNATNLLVFLMSGGFGAPPLNREGLVPEDYSDPMPQVFILTAIVITFGVTAFMLALLYRSWVLARGDTVADDAEDIAIRSVDVAADDEVFDEEDAGDTEFGSDADAAVASAGIPVDELAEAGAAHPDTYASGGSGGTDGSDPADEGGRA